MWNHFTCIMTLHLNLQPQQTKTVEFGTKTIRGLKYKMSGNKKIIVVPKWRDFNSWWCSFPGMLTAWSVVWCVGEGERVVGNSGSSWPRFQLLLNRTLNVHNIIIVFWHICVCLSKGGSLIFFFLCLFIFRGYLWCMDWSCLVFCHDSAMFYIFMYVYLGSISRICFGVTTLYLTRFPLWICTNQ